MIGADKPDKNGLMNVETRARKSKGSSSDPIYQMIARAISGHDVAGGVVLDVGCGCGNLLGFVGDRFERYIGVDVIRYEGFPTEAEFIPLDLDAGKAPLPDDFADVVCSVETIEHLENPRAFMRELVRLVKPGGWVIVTTPNQLSLLSKLTLVLKNQFNAFQEAPGLYPAHITALLEIDLIRIATECGLTDIKIDYSDRGRIPFTSWHWPVKFGFRGRSFSDNVCAIGRSLDSF